MKLPGDGRLVSRSDALTDTIMEDVPPLSLEIIVRILRAAVCTGRPGGVFHWNTISRAVYKELDRDLTRVVTVRSWQSFLEFKRFAINRGTRRLYNCGPLPTQVLILHFEYNAMRSDIESVLIYLRRLRSIWVTTSLLRPVLSSRAAPPEVCVHVTTDSWSLEPGFEARPHINRLILDPLPSITILGLLLDAMPNLAQLAVILPWSDSLRDDNTDIDDIHSDDDIHSEDDQFVCVAQLLQIRRECRRMGIRELFVLDLDQGTSGSNYTFHDGGSTSEVDTIHIHDVRVTLHGRSPTSLWWALAQCNYNIWARTG